MKPTPEQIELYLRLQPFFNEKLGEWKQGDCGWDLLRNHIVFYIGTDNGYRKFINKKGYTGVQTIKEMTRFLRLPSWEQLWGLVDWSFWNMAVFQSGSVYIYPRDRKKRIDITSDSTTAILKALCEQTGV